MRDGMRRKGWYAKAADNAPRDAEMARLATVHGLSGAEIGRIFSLTPSRASQILRIQGVILPTRPMMPAKKAIKHKRMASMHASGASIHEIARCVGMAPSSVYRILWRLGLRERRAQGRRMDVFCACGKTATRHKTAECEPCYQKRRYHDPADTRRERQIAATRRYMDRVTTGKQVIATPRNPERLARVAAMVGEGLEVSEIADREGCSANVIAWYIKAHGIYRAKVAYQAKNGIDSGTKGAA